MTIEVIHEEFEICAGECEMQEDKDSPEFGHCMHCGIDMQPPEIPEGFKVTAVNIVKEGILLPPAPHLCQKCAVDHTPDLPHNQQSMFWQYWFYKDSGGRWPTWRDAMAHCTDEMKALWVKALEEKGVKIDARG